MLRYTYHAREDDREYIDRGVDALNNESARRLAMTIAERIKQEGRLESRMELIQKILNKRFGNISPILEKRLKGSGLDDLYEFEENILDFNNLKDAEKWWDAHEN